MSDRSRALPDTHAIKRLVLCMSLAFAGHVAAQSTTGSVVGTVGDAQPGESIRIEGASGVRRDVPVDTAGRYQATSLPVGTYRVSLIRGGQPISTHEGVALRVGGSAQIDFAADAGPGATAATDLGGVSVSATTQPPIDVSTVDSRTVITAQQLAQLPLARTAEDIALLAPGTASSGALYGSRIGGGGNLVSFGGSSGAENAYYINGFNTTDPYKGEGALQLPYGAIDQQEVLTGGYSAKYGRSDGGVINQVGKSGTNTWHYGFQAQWSPASLEAAPDNIRYANNRFAGDLYTYRQRDTNWTSTYSGYIGGPLIANRLYLFAAAEEDTTRGYTTSTNADPTNPDAQASRLHYKNTTPKWYGKINWNITDNNILELTGIHSEQSSSGTNTNFSYASLGTNGTTVPNVLTKSGGTAYIGKFTSYLTDTLTFTALWGRMRLHDYSAPAGYDPTLPYLQNITDQDPLITGGRSVSNAQTISSLSAPDQGSQNTSLQLNLEWKLGDHTVNVGIDNDKPETIDQGNNQSTWTYGQSTGAIDLANGIGAPGGRGYYVVNEITNGASGVKTVEKAQYVEDNWQITDRFLLTVGVRNDAFANYNNSSVKFTSQNHNWSPRAGFSWDVFGDATLKVFGNLGRYYLAINNNTAYDGATGYLWQRNYYTYTGIAANGMPTGLGEFGAYDVNGHTGQAPDPATVASKNLGAEYQDEFILGATKALGDAWIAGIKGTFRKLRQISDDVCDSDDLLIAKTKTLYGLTDDQITANRGACYIFNPGKSNDFRVATTNGYVTTRMSDADWGFTQGPKRNYYALEMFLEHPLANGPWGGRLDYVFSRSYGNSSGLLTASRGDDSVGVTQDWDNAYVMENANGLASNNHTHQIKLNGVYRFSPEWMVSGVVRVASGAPRYCLGFYGPTPNDPATNNPDGYGSLYHWCNGQPSPPGKQGDLPWTRQVDLNLTYAPAFADHRLSFNLSVFNVINEQRPLAIYSRYNSSATPSRLNDLYGTATVLEPPRYVRFGVNYDF
ncbi:TonB-dependent receptor [Luteibacter sahnii]|uniref:TonB-dependent receptor n=1 Tax=Luteibacter sahnii TaxID=3021977 RepID=UPI002A6B351E|nr:TonB-dependent receptor [Luteibacter sp. PPL193]MDY1547937.1 TonB-dependent receptor [Luteibacter sp. PPL193]